MRLCLRVMDWLSSAKSKPPSFPINPMMQSGWLGDLIVTSITSRAAAIMTKLRARCFPDVNREDVP